MTYLETAIAAAKLGGRILMENFAGEKRTQINEKARFDFVTQVDLLSEKAIIDFIREQHPEHDILAEESGTHAGNGNFEWIIDPLDGTTNYIHGFPFFAVSVALRRDSELLVGAVLDPIRGELFHAEKDKGAFLNNSPIRVSTTDSLQHCLLATGFPFRAKHIVEPYFEAFISFFHQVSDLRRAGAAALDLASVACGRLDGFWEIGLNIWDIAAGVLIIAEAGGKVTGIHGEDDFLQTGNLVCSNTLLHQRLMPFVSEPFRNVSL